MGRPAKGPHPFHVTITRYVAADGRRCRKDTPGAIKVTTKSASYYANLPVSGKRPERVPLETTDLAVAWRKLRDLLKRRHEESLGIRDHFTEAAGKPLVEHLDDWIATVAAGETTAKQLWALRHSLDVLAEVAGWARITDISHDSCALALAALRAPRGRRKKGLSAQTRNHYLSHAKQFCAWARGPGLRLRDNPLAGLEPVDTSTDRRHDRRVPTDDEVAKLFERLERPDAEVLEGMTGLQRALGYRLAMSTGLRAGELRSLARGSFDLEAGTVVVPASYSKRRREDTQHLAGWLVEQLAAWFAAGGACWSGFPEVHPGQVLKLDLAAAGVPYRVVGQGGTPLFFDFHSLRHWYCVWAADLPGISPRTLLALTRHSTVELAMGVYGRSKKADVTDAIRQMPEPGRPARDAATPEPSPAS